MDSSSMSFTSQGKNIISTVLSFLTGSPPSENNCTQSDIIMTEKRGYQEISPFETEISLDSTPEIKSDLSMAGGWKIGNILEKMHKRTPQEELWFSAGGGRDENIFLPSNNQQVPNDFYPTNWYSNNNNNIKNLSNTSNQMAFNITKNCYESLPVSQMIPHIPYYQHMPDVDQSPVYQEQIMTNIMDLVEDSLVEMVCLKSSIPSPHRLAAQTLANSDLNPNAKEFTPKLVIESVIVDPSDSINEEDLIESILEDSIKSDDEILDPSLNIEIAKDSRAIEECVKECVDVGRSYNCDFLLVPIANDTDGEDSLDGDEDSDWWDSDDEETNGQCIEIDPFEFQDLMSCPLFVPNNSVRKNSSCSSKQTPSPEEDTLVDSSEKVESENSDSIYSEANLCKINELYFCDNNDDVPCIRTDKCKVQFCDNLNEVIDEPDDISEDLAKARVSDFKTRQADKERMEILLRPILSSLHREKKYKEIYGENLEPISIEKKENSDQIGLIRQTMIN